MGVLSPDDYRRAAGYRRSSATRLSPSDVPTVSALNVMDFDSADLADFLRGGRESISGVAVSHRMAVRNSSFFRASCLISSAIGMLPTFLMRKTILADGTEKIEKARDHALFRILHKKPNSYQTAFEFKSYMQQNALFDGNAHALVIRDWRGQVAQLIPLPRGSCKPKLSDDWQLTFEYRRPSGGYTVLPASDIFHFRHPLTHDGLNGISLMDVARDTIGVAHQAEKAAGKLFSTGMMAGGALEADGELGEEAIKNLKESLRDDHSGAENAGSWLILEDGLKAKPFVTSAKDAQYDELRKRADENMARFTGAPRPLLMMDETAWGTGIRELGLFFVTYGLMMWFVAWEQAVMRSCLTQAEQDADELYVKFNEGALLRGSLKEQADFFKAALGPNGSFMTPNEVRANFELNPRDDGKDLPKASAVAAKLAKDTQDD